VNEDATWVNIKDMPKVLKYIGKMINNYSHIVLDVLNDQIEQLEGE
jgi:hypothetical protein